MLGVDPAAERRESVTDPAARAPSSCSTPTGWSSAGAAPSTRAPTGWSQHLRELADRPLDDLCDALLRRMLHGTPQDDVALVAVRIAPGLARAVRRRTRTPAARGLGGARMGIPALSETP